MGDEHVVRLAEKLLHPPPGTDPAVASRIRGLVLEATSLVDDNDPMRYRFILRHHATQPSTRDLDACLAEARQFRNRFGYQPPPPNMAEQRQMKRAAAEERRSRRLRLLFSWSEQEHTAGEDRRLLVQAHGSTPVYLLSVCLKGGALCDVVSYAHHIVFPETANHTVELCQQLRKSHPRWSTEIPTLLRDGMRTPISLCYDVFPHGEQQGSAFAADPILHLDVSLLVRGLSPNRLDVQSLWIVPPEHLQRATELLGQVRIVGGMHCLCYCSCRQVCFFAAPPPLLAPPAAPAVRKAAARLIRFHEPFDAAVISLARVCLDEERGLTDIYARVRDIDM